jgi:Tfp pilus assembly protein PilO
MTARARQPFWRRRLLPVVLAVAGVNLVLFLAFTWPRSWRIRSVASRADALREAVARERAASAALRRRVETAANNARDVDRFFKDLVPPRDEVLVATLEDIEAMAHKPGLVAGRRNYAREEVKGTPITRLAISLPLEGSYEQLVDFLASVERGKRFLTVDRIAISQNRSERGESARLQVELSAFFTSGKAARDAHGD